MSHVVITRRSTPRVMVGNIAVGGEAPVVVQSMTNTDTADIQATTQQVYELAEAGSELVRITVNTSEAAAAVPHIRARLNALGCRVPLVGDFHYNGHRLLTEFPGCAQALAKYRINPGNVGKNRKGEDQFAMMINVAKQYGKPVRIGVIDGDPAPAAPPLQAAALYRHVFGQAGVGTEHAAAVVCELVCAPAAGFSGLARGAQLWAAPVLREHDGRVFSDTATVACALDWLSSQRVNLVNLSLGSAPDAVLARVVAAAQRSGVRLVAAAGNAGPNRPLPYPAALPGVIAVAAVDAAAQPYAQGNRGAQVLLTAPGVDLWLPIGGGRYFTGTSFAAPWVTAWLAQRLSRGQPADEAALCAAARDLPPPGRDPASGCGLLRWGP